MNNLNCCICEKQIDPSKRKDAITCSGACRKKRYDQNHRLIKENAEKQPQRRYNMEGDLKWAS